ncbi:MAG: HI0074 family nucleotidyltransferase substrate-binding subunit, partial [Endomicrobiaceae bacterium]|nr:HI0074 family nucleotidyltransferase substrate-binding subunit [Endomicrobiaceae bacterium]
MKLDLTSFISAITSFKEAIDKYNEDTTNSFVRDSVIQRFEYTYSLALKMIKRYLETNTLTQDEVDSFSFNDMIRVANENGLLLTDLEFWNKYREKRNITSHTYDVQKAKEVISVVNDFYKDVDYLLKQI